MYHAIVRRRVVGLFAAVSNGNARIGIYPDTVGVVTTLQRLSRAGVAEATAEKIEG